MSRSRKKPFVWISKPWTKYKERAFRHRAKQVLHEIEIDFDPDADFLELTDNHKKMGSWGTKYGWDMPPDESDDTRWHENYIELQRK